MKKLLSGIVFLGTFLLITSFNGTIEIPGDISNYTLLVELFEERDPEAFKNKTVSNSYFDSEGKLLYHDMSKASEDIDKKHNLQQYIIESNKQVEKRNNSLYKKFTKYYKSKVKFVKLPEIDNYEEETHRYVIKFNADLFYGTRISERFYIYDRKLKKSYRQSHDITDTSPFITILNKVARINR